MDFKNFLEKINDPKFRPLILVAIGFGIFAFFSNKKSEPITQDNIIEDIPESTQYYDIMAFGEDMLSGIQLTLTEQLQKNTSTITEELTTPLTDINKNLQTLTEKVSNIPAPTKIIQPPKENSNSLPTPKITKPKITPKYFTIEPYTGMNPYEGTLGGIAIKFNTTIEKLLSLNKYNSAIKDKDTIISGKKIRVA